MTMPFPDIDPVALELGPLVIRWYALAYIAGVAFAWWYCTRLAVKRLAAVPHSRPHLDDLGDFVFWVIPAIILGGRIGFVLFYNLPHYLQHPLEVLYIWQGGMSFHGGMAGVVIAILLYCRHERFSPFALGDLIAVAAPVGLFLGRVANFVNGELYGRAAGPDVPWALVFPHDPLQIPRHPSQLYEAVLEGLVLFIALAWLARRPGILERTGTLSGLFLIGYGVARTMAEFFREPDVQLGYLAFGVTMGQVLSLPMIALGLWMVWRAPFGIRAAGPR